MTLRQGNRTFAEIPSTFGALTRLVNASKPATKPLTTLLERLHPLVTTATPVVHNFNLAISRPGPDNDLTDLVRALPALAETTVHELAEQRHRPAGMVPITAFFRSLRARPRGHPAQLRADQRLLRRRRPLRPRQPGLPDFNWAPATISPRRARSRPSKACRPASCAAVPAARPNRPPTGPRRSPTTNCSAATPWRRPDESAPQLLPGRQPASDRGGDDAAP